MQEMSLQDQIVALTAQRDQLAAEKQDLCKSVDMLKVGCSNVESSYKALAAEKAALEKQWHELAEISIQDQVRVAALERGRDVLAASQKLHYCHQEKWLKELDEARRERDTALAQLKEAREQLDYYRKISSPTDLNDLEIKNLRSLVEDQEADIRKFRDVLENWKRQTLQIDNGTCSICRIGHRFFDTKGNPGQCPREGCFSREVDAALNGAGEETNEPAQSGPDRMSTET